jgi:hypothetical protein
MLWRYTENVRNFRGWHLTADSVGCESLIALVDALAADAGQISRVFEVSPPTERALRVPNNRSGTAAWLTPAKLRITNSDDPEHWRFTDALDTAELVLGADWLPRLRAGIAGIEEGLGDYSIGDHSKGNMPLWFWWRLGSP